MIVLIPAYEPDERLVELVDALRHDGHRMLVVDDGSGSGYDEIFADVTARGVAVLRSTVNRGKGTALKSGLQHIRERWPEDDVITADSDGQHRPSDVSVVAIETAKGDALVLGGRAFEGSVPARSRFGNAVSRLLFRASGGPAIRDTQTGLRGIPAHRVHDVVRVPGERFEWEMNVLLSFARRHLPIREVPIATVYIDGNASSHFRPVHDSFAVLRPMLRYVAVAFGSFLLDLAALQLFFLATGELLFSAVMARMISAAVNFTMNRLFVFPGAGSGALRRQLLRYATLSIAMLAGGYCGLWLLTGWGVPVVPAKILADAAVFVCGYLAQRSYVFAKRTAREKVMSGAGGT